MMEKMQFWIKKHSHTFVVVSACNRGSTQFIIETEQAGFSTKGITLGLADIEPHEGTNAPSTNTICIPLK
jgi:hypothetical protein